MIDETAYRREHDHALEEIRVALEEATERLEGSIVPPPVLELGLLESALVATAYAHKITPDKMAEALRYLSAAVMVRVEAGERGPKG